MKFIIRLAALAAAFGASPAWAQQKAGTLDGPAAGRFAALALSCVQKEYPNKIAHVLNSPADIKSPQELTPAFYGCYDWHSSVHGHWLLARLVRAFPDAPFAADAIAALEANITPARIAGEVAYLNATGRESFERPYGLAWLLQLSAELRESQAPRALALSSVLQPLEAAVVARLEAWLPKLAYPIREGEHPQTAFAFGLILDYARESDPELAATVTAKLREFHLNDRDCPISYEPSGQDFLSPCIAEADVMRRVLPPEEFAGWLKTFLPRIPTTGSGTWLPIGIVTDRTDGKLAHLDGLNLSRAWMLEGIAAGLPSGDQRIPALLAAAEIHAASGLASVTGEHYAGGHWLGSFATYLTTRRGIDPVAADLDRLRSATNRFHELDSAVAAGYPREVASCLVHEHHGAMGYHHVNTRYLSPNLEIEKPQILLYERMADSSYRLNAVEYIIPYRLWPRDSVAPVLMGQKLHREDNLKFWYLHAWVWLENPGGTFANFHPGVSCPESTRKVYLPFPSN